MPAFLAVNEPCLPGDTPDSSSRPSRHSRLLTSPRVARGRRGRGSGLAGKEVSQRSAPWRSGRRPRWERSVVHRGRPRSLRVVPRSGSNFTAETISAGDSCLFLQGRGCRLFFGVGRGS